MKTPALTRQRCAMMMRKRRGLLSCAARRVNHSYAAEATPANMQLKSLKRMVLIARWGTVLLVTAGVAACAGVVVGGDFPLTAALWCMLLWPLALVGAIVWMIASSKLRREHPPTGPRGFDVIPQRPPE